MILINNNGKDNNYDNKINENDNKNSNNDLNDDEKVINTNIDFDKYINEILSSDNVTIECQHIYAKDGDPYSEEIIVSNDIIPILLEKISEYSAVEPLPDGIGNPFATYSFYINYDDKVISISTSSTDNIWFLNSEENNLFYSFDFNIIKEFETLIKIYKK